MKRILIICFILCQYQLWAQDLPAALYRSMDSLSQAYQQAYPGSGMKAGLVILPIEEDSSLARKNQLGKTIEVYLRDTVSRSLVYELVDRENLDKLLEEMEFSLSGLVDTDTIVNIGNLAGVRAFLWGSIGEIRDQFLVSLGVTDAETGKVLATSSFEIAQYRLVQLAEELQYSYVAPNGIGITGHLFVPFYLLSDIYNNGPLILADSGLAYRFSRKFMLSAGVLSAPNFTGSQYSLFRRIPVADYQPTLPELVPDWKGDIYQTETQNLSQYSSQFRASFIRLDAQYTLSFSPKFNVGLAGGIFNALGNVRMFAKIGGETEGLYYRKLLAQETDPETGEAVAGGFYYDQPFIDTTVVEYLFMDQFIPGIRAELRPEVFITPRIAVSARLGFLWMLPLKVREIHAREASWWFYQKGKDPLSWSPDPAYDPAGAWVNDTVEQRASWRYYGWNPLLRPDGKYWTYDISSAYIYVGFSFFF